MERETGILFGGKESGREREEEDGRKGDGRQDGNLKPKLAKVRVDRARPRQGHVAGHDVER